MRTAGVVDEGKALEDLGYDICGIVLDQTRMLVEIGAQIAVLKVLSGDEHRILTLKPAIGPGDPRFELFPSAITPMIKWKANLCCRKPG
jgi:hypothetical protein